MNTQIACVMIIVAIILFTYMLIKLNKNIRLKAYELFLKAEHEISSGGGKMDYVVENIHNYLPTIVSFFISEETLKKILQKMFDEIKDLLDDGKRNKSTKGSK